jgi:hypothetical protein
VPLGMAAIDYAAKEVRLIDYIRLSGDPTTDLAHIRAAYRDCRGLRPQHAAPVDFALQSEQRAEDSCAG